MGGSKKKNKRQSRRLSTDAPGFRGSEVEDLSDEELDDTPMKEKGGSNPQQIEVLHNGFWQRQAIRMARMPRVYLAVSAILSIVLSVIAFTVGGFDASVDNKGWQSRGTLIADRQTQLMMAESYQQYLFSGGPSAWDDLSNNVQPGWQGNNLSGEADESLEDTGTNSSRLLIDVGDDFSLSPMVGHRKLSSQMRNRLEAELDGCNVDWYFNYTQREEDEHLWPIWRAESPSTNLFQPSLLYDVCVAEQNTQRVLEAKGLCFGCETGCLPPFGTVLNARLIVDNGFQMDCKELSDSWGTYQEATENTWATCVKDVKEAFDPNNEWEMPESCPVGFSTALVEENFDVNKWMTLTSSIYATREKDVEALYEIVDEFDQGTDAVTGVYDTQYEGFNQIFTDAVVARDMILACGSAFITAVAILIHTKSPFLTGVGLMQIILSFPLSFFVYTFVGGLEFFPFLNFIGVFVVFALGADDIFVAVDKWKIARIEHPNADTEFVAAIALPDGACSMFLTTITTAIAFFGTAICPVAPIKLFAIFCGLLIMFDYLMCILLVFPALCIYDKKLMENRSNCCNACHCFQKKGDVEDQDDSAEHGEFKLSLIHRLLSGYYDLLHRFRWPLLAICAGAFGAAAYGATTLELPTTAEVRLIEEDSVQYEQNFVWRQELLYKTLEESGGSRSLLGFGLLPADTGDHNNPNEWSQLVLDPTFDAAPEESQKFLESFCPTLFAEDFAITPEENYTCAFNSFALWLEEQSVALNPSASYVSECANATGIPIPEASFDACMIAWSKEQEETSILSNEGKVRIIFLPFVSRVRGSSPFDDLEAEWNLIEDWVTKTASTAPASVNKFFFSSMTFWWFDTNSQMLSTAYGAASIALAAAAAVLFLSSRSFVLTVFATLTILYVLCSVTSTLVLMGWTLGFLESICFAILIGVSVDFVIHFCHAYSHKSGEISRHERTKDALIRMGPSILAAGVTTVSAAIIMLFTIISFFQKFALILFMTIVQATIGSFVVFLVMTDCLGPSNPTYLVDKAVEKIWCKKRKGEATSGGSSQTSSELEKSGKFDGTERTESLRNHSLRSSVGALTKKSNL